MKISSSNYSNFERMRNQLPTTNRNNIQSTTTPLANSFETILEEVQYKKEASELKFSKHASVRLENRNISLTQEQLLKLEEGTKKAKSKGINESLVVVDGLSFIVSVKNNTVITAINEEEEQVFTNIDGAVIM